MERSHPIAAALLALSLLGCNGSQPPPAQETTIFTGVRFWTGDPANPWAEALLVSEGKIVRTIERDEIAKQLAAGGTVVTLSGAVAVPGLVDAHAHLAGYALGRRQVDLTGTTTLEAALELVRQFVAAHPNDRWVIGRGWDQTDWSSQAWPDADRLEQVVPGRPVALTRVDGHALWVNRTALSMAKIDADTPDPPGGSIHREARRRPTGILIDNAMSLVERAIPEPTDAMLEEALAAAAVDLLAVGLTGVHDMGFDTQTRDAIDRLQRRHRWPLRVVGYASFGNSLYRELIGGGPQQIGRIKIPGVKLYADGALGSRGARLLAPYTDEPGSQGLWVTAPEKLREAIEELAAHELQPAVHAIGDAANRTVLDAFEVVEKRKPSLCSLRPRVEHAQIVDPADIARFAPLGAIASMQPTHATSDMPWAVARLGSDRLAGAYAWRSMLAARAPLAFGSDFPVESIDPRLGLYAGATRQDKLGRPPGGWLPAQKLSLEELLTAFTHGAAYAARQEDQLGRLAPGYWCDITVFGRDLFGSSPDSWQDTPVTATIIGGQVVTPTSQNVAASR